MLYTLTQKRLQPVPAGAAVLPEDVCCGFFPLPQYEEIAKAFQLPALFSQALAAGKATRFESHDGFDLMVVERLDGKTGRFSPQPLLIYLSQRYLFLFCDGALLADMQRALTQEADSFSRVLIALFKRLTAQDDQILEQLENQITRLEDRLLSAGRGDYVAEIIHIRRRLTQQKSYYDQLYNILDGILENENHLIPAEAMRYFKIFAHKVDRLSSHTNSLRDYITQVREAYQAQEDIRLNKTMKVLTVITAVIAPLTLIAGWYGMNLKMPEYGWAFGYPLVIGISAVAVGGCIAYFKKHKWF